METPALYKSSLIGLRHIGEGMVNPWNDYKLPVELQDPLRRVAGQEMEIIGFESGERSAFAMFNYRWFKLKGCNYQEKHGVYSEALDPTGKASELSEFKGIYAGSGEPWGAMSKKKCLNELKTAEIIGEKYSEFGLSYPMKPAGSFEYDKKFKGENVSCAILEIKTDTRLRTVLEALTRNPKYNIDYMELISGIIEWLGFDQYLFKESNISLPSKILGIGNYLVWDTGKGYGVSRIDLGSSVHKKDQELLEGRKRDEWNTLIGYAYPFSLLSLKKKLDIDIKPFMLGYDDTDGTATYFKMVKNDAPEVVETRKKEKTLFVRENRFDWIAGLEDLYQNALEGNIPQPIDRKTVESIFIS